MLIEIYIIFIAFIIGVCIGSFVGVLIDRIPRKESIVNPPSHCINCGHRLKWSENIPVVSYLLLDGKCSNCRTQIPIKWFFLELAFGIIGAGIAYFILKLL